MAEVDFFTLLYPIVPLAGIAGYVPQLVSLLKASEAPKSISLSTWFIWTTTWLVSFGYAVFALQDILFATTSGMNLGGHLLIIFITIYKEQKYKAPQAQQTSLHNTKNVPNVVGAMNSWAYIETNNKGTRHVARTLDFERNTGKPQSPHLHSGLRSRL